MKRLFKWIWKQIKRFIKLMGNMFMGQNVPKGNTILLVSPTTWNPVATSDKTIISITSNTRWIITVDQPWLGVTGDINGEGDRNVEVTVTANPNTTSRKGTITVSTQGGGTYKVINVTQAAKELVYNLIANPNNFNNVPREGQILQSTITSENMTWTYISQYDWITVNPRIGGNGQTNIEITVLENTTLTSRNATLLFDGSVSGYQAAIAIRQNQGVSVDYLNISPTSNSVDSSQGSYDISVESNTSWSVTSDSSWLTVNYSNGIGSDVLTYSYSSNPQTIQRVGKLTFTNQAGTIVRTFTLTQAAGGVIPTNYINVNPETLNFTATGESQTVSITSNTGYTITADVAFIGISHQAGQEDLTLTVTAPNNTQAARSGYVVITSSDYTITKRVLVNQAAAGSTDYLTVNPASIQFQATDTSTKTVSISSNLSWNVTKDQTWLHIDRTSGTNDGTLSLTVEPNSTGTYRDAEITVKSSDGRFTSYVAVNQIGSSVADYLNLDKTSTNPVASAGSTAVGVLSNVQWTVSSNADWLTVNPTSGSSNGTTTVSWTNNTSTSSRTGILTYRNPNGTLSAYFTVTQAGISESETLTLSTYSQTVTAISSSINVNVYSNTGWTAHSDSEWLIMTPDTGNLNGTLRVVFGANPNISPRSGNIIVVTNSGRITRTLTIDQVGRTAYYITVDPNVLTFGNQAESKNAKVRSNTHWLVDVPDWVRVNPDSGMGSESSTEFNVVISVDENTSTGSREEVVRFTTNFMSEEAELHVSQSGTQDKGDISITPSSEDHDYTAGSITAIVSSTRNWSTSYQSSRLTISQTSGVAGDTQVTISWPITEGWQTNQWTVTTDDDQRATFTLNQTARPTDIEINVTPQSRTAGIKAGSTSFNIVSNTNWVASVVSGSEWASIIGSAIGTGDGSININYSANTDLFGRNAIIEVRSTEDTLVYQRVTIVQAGNGFISVYPDSVTVTRNNLSATATVTAGAPWSATVTSGVGWIYMEPSSGGAGETLVEITTEGANYYREGSIQFELDDDARTNTDLTVIQQA